MVIACKQRASFLPIEFCAWNNYNLFLCFAYFIKTNYSLICQNKNNKVGKHKNGLHIFEIPIFCSLCFGENLPTGKFVMLYVRPEIWWLISPALSQHLVFQNLVVGLGQKFLTRVRSGQIFGARVGSGQSSLVWVWRWKISL